MSQPIETEAIWDKIKRKIFVRKADEATGRLRKLHNEKSHSF
jgi:hypothetical protein